MQQRDELTRVLDDEVGAELDRGRARLLRPELPAGDDARPRADRAQRLEAPRRRLRSRPPSPSRARPGRAARTPPAPRCRRAGAPVPSCSTSQPSASRKSATMRVPSACSSSGVPLTIASRPSFGGARAAAAEPVEDRLGDRGRVVLLGDVERAHRPPVPDLPHRGLEHARGRCRGSATPSSSACSTARRARAESRASKRVQEPDRCSSRVTSVSMPLQDWSYGRGLPAGPYRTVHDP